MALDARKNFAISAVATAPSPATTGTSLGVTTNDGVKLPAVPFNAVVWPSGAAPVVSNAEIVRVTAIATDTLTIVRTQEASTVRTIVVGDQIMAGLTAKTISDIEAALSGKAATGANSDITSLAGLTTALSTPQGGTGSTTATGSGANVLANSPVITTGTVAADPTAALGIVSKQYVDNQASTSAVAIDAAAYTLTASKNLVSVTLTNVPPGDYAIDINFACTPSGDGNGSVSAAITGSTGTLTKKDGSIHSSDADYNTTHYLQRASFAILQGHTGGTFTVNAAFTAESAVNYVFGQANDVRWATVLRVAKIG